MLRLSAEGGDTDLIVMRKYGKNDWALKISLHYTLWWQRWETEVIKVIAIYIKSIFHKLKKKNICTVFSFPYFETIQSENLIIKLLWHHYKHECATNCALIFYLLFAFIHKQSCYSKLINVIVIHITCKGFACFALPTLLHIWPSPNLNTLDPTLNTLEPW